MDPLTVLPVELLQMIFQHYLSNREKTSPLALPNVSSTTGSHRWQPGHVNLPTKTYSLFRDKGHADIRK